MKSSRQQKVLNHFSSLLLFAFIFVNVISVFAGPGRTTYQAKIVKPDGYPLEASSVNFKFTILDPVGSCILYSETYSSVNMTSTGGLISFSLGSGVKTYPVSATTFEQVFSNITPSLSCDTGGPANYSPTATDIRKIVMQFHDGIGWQTLPAMSINAVPYAMYANEATKLNGLTSSDFVQVSTVPTCTASEALRYTGASFSCVAVGNSVTSSTVVTALGYTPADSVSLTTVTSDLSTVSSTVAGVSAYASGVSSTVFSVSSTVTSLQNSVAASFAAITSSQWTTSGTNIFYNTGNIGIGTSTPVTKLDVSGGVRIGGENTTCAPALAGTLRYNASNVEYCNGTSWQAFGVSGAGITNFNGSTSGTQSFANATGGTAPAFNTSNGVHTLNIPNASTGSVTAGLISNTDYTTFSNKITSSAASIAQVLGYVPADNAASGTYTQKANNLSDLTNIATARTNLGLGTFATASSIDLGSASATGTLAIARLPAFSGDATIAAASNTIILANSGVTVGTYTKVTVDSKGRVTSGAQIVSSDVTTALGYTPANSATTVSSQWSTSGTTINYMNGNVGIGTTNPSTTLEVNGAVAISGSNDLVMRASVEDAGDLIFRNSSGTQKGRVWSESGVGLTGLYLSSGDTTPDIHINNAGNVGVGITAPTAVLHVTAGTSSTASFKFTSGTLLTSTQAGTMEYDGTNFYLTDSTNTRRAIAANTNPGTYDNVSNINSSSNITLTPTGSVVVSSTTASTNSSTGALVVKGGLGVAGSINTAGNLNVSGSSLIDGSLKLSNMTSGSVLFAGANGTVTQDNANFYWDGANRRLGIGTSSPTEALQIANGGLRVNGAIGATNVGGVYLDWNSSANIGRVIAGNASTSSLAFSTNTGGATSERMRIDSSGNVGIGTSAPSTTLEVSGTAQISAGSDGVNSFNTHTRISRSSMVMGTPSSVNAIAESVVGSLGFLGYAQSHGQVAYIASSSNGRFEFKNVSAGGPSLNISDVNTYPYANVVLGRLGFGTSNTVTMLSNTSVNHGDSSGIGGHTSRSISWEASNQGYVAALANTDATATSRNGLLVKTAATDADSYIARFESGGSNKMTIRSDGNVGIGTTSPSYRLNVVDSDASTNTVKEVASFYHDTSGTPAAGLGASIVLGSKRSDGNLTGSGRISSIFTDPTVGIEDADLRFETLLNSSWNEGMRITSNGNVGIGTTSPSGVLSMNMGAGLGNAHFGGLYPDLWFDGGTDSVFYLSNRGVSTGRTSITYNSTELFTVTNSGTVGIGAVAPTSGYKLDVNGDIYVGDSGSSQKIQFKTANTDGGFIRFNSTADSAGNSSLEIGTTDNNDEPITFTQTANERMRIHTNGYVGIGTATPAQKLDVTGNIAVAGDIYGGLYGGTRGIWRFSTADPNYGIFYTEASPDVISFSPQGGGTTSPAMVIAGNNVGIGTTTPDDRLVVYNGSTTGRYTTGGWTHTSDARLKHDIKPLENSLEKVVQLRGVAYTYNNDPQNKSQVGFLAQEVEPIFPQVVVTDKKGFKSMIYANLVAPLVEAIKELFQRLLGVEQTLKEKSQEIEMLKAKSSQLEEQNKALKEYLCEKDPSAKICK